MRRVYKIVLAYDTETYTQYNKNDYLKSNAWPVAYQFNFFMQGVNNYQYGDGKFYLFRRAHEVITFIENVISLYKPLNIVPICVAYNLPFDIQSIYYSLSKKYKFEVLAKSSTNYFTLDLIDVKTDEIVFRFWDTFYLEMGGLAAMGKAAGIPKLYGQFDYTKYRTQNTPFTNEEIEYMRHDVEIIPAYLAFILQQNDYLNVNDLGTRIISKTGLLRVWAARTSDRNIKRKFYFYALHDLPANYQAYIFRKAAYNGGLTFSSGTNSNKLMRNVYSLDAVSMHHAFINGRRVPVKWRWSKNRNVLTEIAKKIIKTPINVILQHYEQPFTTAFHGIVKFKNLKLKGIFKNLDMGILPESKFATTVQSNYGFNGIPDTRAKYAETVRIAQGWRNHALNPTFAYSKLISADEAALFLNELELYCVSLVYSFSDIVFLEGEYTHRWQLPPEYVTRQSIFFYDEKNKVKQEIKKETNENKKNELEKYYTISVKGKFNSVYGVQAQDFFKPDFIADENGLVLDETTKITNNENFQKKYNTIKNPAGAYTYGMRIVGGSRLHLILAIMLITYKCSNVKIISGDTDSLKIATPQNYNPTKLLDALAPLHNAIRKALDYCVGENTLDKVGNFEIENPEKPYDFLIERWNKTRLINDKGNIKITAAGVSRPPDKYNINNAAQEYYEKNGAEALATEFMVFNTYIPPDVAHSLEGIPQKFDKTISIDNEDIPVAIPLVEIGRLLGDTSKRNNRHTIQYLNKNANDYPLRTIYRGGIIK